MSRARATDSRFAAFDGLRAIAALMVVTYHVTLWSGYSRLGPLAGAAAELKAGVAVFFVISGLLLYLPHARAIRDGEPAPSWRRYARRRVLRVIPAYWLVLSVVAIGPFAAGVMNPDVWRFYGLTQIYDPGTIFSGLGVSWSLAVEVSFYALLPLLARAIAWAVRRLTGVNPAATQISIFLAVGVTSIAFREMLAGSPVGAVSNDLVTSATALPALMDWFAIGMAFAVLAVDWEAGGSIAGWLARLARAPWACWLLALACFAAGIPSQGGDLFLTLYGPATHVAIGLAAGLFVLPAIAPVRGVGAFPVRLLTRPALAWLGTISYGIYLWHVPVLIFLRGPFTPRLHPIGAGAAIVLLSEVVVGAIGLGAASWYLLERPILRSGARGAPDLNIEPDSVDKRLVTQIARGHVATRLTKAHGALIASGLLGFAIVAYVTLRAGGSGDYSIGSPVAGDNAGPALGALIHGHLWSFVTHQPLMGLGSLLLRAPVAGLGILLGADAGLAYGLGALVCLLPLTLLAAWMVGRQGPREQRLCALLAAAIVLAGPATIAAVQVGHPEEVLAATLATGAVLAAIRHRPGWAWMMLGLAVGTKQWALLAAPCVLLALPDRRLATGVKAGALGLALSATLPLLDPAAFARADSVVGGLRFTDPLSLWWPLGTSISAPAHATFMLTAHLLPFGLQRSAAAGAGLMLAVGAMWLYGSRRADPRTPVDPLALLAWFGLIRCITDPDPLQYNFVALLIPLAAWESVQLVRLPLATAVAAGSVAALAGGSVALRAGVGPHLAPGLLSGVSIAWTIALGCYLARRVVHAPALFASSRPGAIAFGSARRIR